MAEVVCIASWNVDLVAQVSEPLARGQTLLASHFERLPGGKGSNAAIAAARLGARVGLVARVGGDDFGQMGLDLWAREGIDVRYVQRAQGQANGTALILVYPDGDNSIAIYPGAGSGLDAQQVEQARDMIGGARLVMASCEVPLSATLAAFSWARAQGVITLLNPAPAMALPEALWPLIDVLTPNEGELHQLAGLAGMDQAAQALLARGVGAVVVTLGARGCRLYRTGHEPVAVAGHAVEVVDTIGAGDTFTGALAAGLARRSDWPQALASANAAAALSTQGRGAVAAMPSLAQVQRWLDQR